MAGESDIPLFYLSHPTIRSRWPPSSVATSGCRASVTSLKLRVDRPQADQKPDERHRPGAPVRGSGVAGSLLPQRSDSEALRRQSNPCGGGPRNLRFHATRRASLRFEVVEGGVSEEVMGNDVKSRRSVVSSRPGRSVCLDMLGGGVFFPSFSLSWSHLIASVVAVRHTGKPLGPILGQILPVKTPLIPCATAR